MRFVMTTRRTMLAVLLLVLISGCAGPGGLGPGGGSIQTNLESFDALCDGADPFQVAPGTTVLPKDALLTLVSRCVTQTQRVPGDGEWQIMVKQEATTQLEALADALRLPVERPKFQQVCAAMVYAPVIIKVTDSTDRAMVPAVPHDACQAPLRAVTEALDALGACQVHGRW